MMFLNNNILYLIELLRNKKQNSSSFLQTVLFPGAHNKVNILLGAYLSRISTKHGACGGARARAITHLKRPGLILDISHYKYKSHQKLFAVYEI